MRLRTLYTTAGLVLGALAGLAVMFQVFAVSAGVSWLFLFGDSPWPASAERYLIAIPVAAGLATLCAGVGIGYAAGRRSEASADRQRARQRGFGLLIAGLALLLLVLALATVQHERQSAAREVARSQEAAFDALRRARHVITKVRVGDIVGVELPVAVELAGTRSGAYRLTWRLEDPLYRVTLASSERRLDLGPVEATVDLAFETSNLAARYRETVLKGRDAKVLVDGTFSLRLSLEPVLDEDERRALPPREIGNLERGLSELRFETEAKVPVRLDLTAP